MLKNIPKIISPELLKILCEMGHGDEIVIADGNFPSASIGQRVVYLTGNGAAEVLNAVLRLMPLDTYAKPLYLMEVVKGDNVKTPIWDEYKEIAKSIPMPDLNTLSASLFMSVQKKHMRLLQRARVHSMPIYYLKRVL